MRPIWFFLFSSFMFFGGCTLLPNTDENYVKPVPSKEKNDPSILVDRIERIQIDKNKQGVILVAFATAKDARQWDAKLVELNRGKPLKGVLRYALKILPAPPASAPADPTPPQEGREFVVGIPIAQHLLTNLQRIEVVGMKNRRTLTLAPAE